MTRIKVELVDVYCTDTEDLIDGDEFYIVGAVGSYSKLGAKFDNLKVRPVLTKPIKISKDQQKPFGQGGGIVFDADVPENHTLYISLAGLDEDVSRDWSQYGPMLTTVGDAISTGLKVIPAAPAVIAGIALPLAIAGLGVIAALDQDDKLGELRRDLPIAVLRNGVDTQYWNFRQDGWWSSWRYTVTYKIHKG